MQLLGGVLMLLLALLCWVGQTIVLFAPAIGVKLGLSEAETDVEPAFWADVRGEALWDFLTLWTLVVAAVLLILDRSAWAYFGLIGGGMYLYFAGRGISTRVAMLRRGLRIGSSSSVRLGLLFLALWAIMGFLTILGSLVSLRSG